MKSVLLLALSLIFVGVWSQDSARGQTSAAPPVSLSPPHASPPHAGAKNSRPPPAASIREASPPVIGGLPSAPNPAVDYDGFSVGAGDGNDTSSLLVPPVRSRTAKGSRADPGAKGAAEQLIDQEDEALKRKLMICQSCK
ncbi:hypothetical protein [Bradyrhizobium sp. CSS354]|uniref:hypothetical protein n=1 Tax=Bradyrhizobium sp. CSS354 TaxID=2699172 RepID=UPI0023B203C5|nr:hypothetical protein [Bradyrhizobium sp. CSS354]MDE5459760.1 hypothetical protein [Bradyrhizobium sp. CSS354]